MQRLFQFLFKYRTFILLIILEGICFWLIVKSNSYQRAKYFTSSSQLTASISSTSDKLGDYFDLTSQNRLLAEENAKLRQQLLNLTDSSFMAYILEDSNKLGIKAKVIDNSLFFRNNYLTIDKGERHGVTPGMGVIGSTGIVGQVGNVTTNYSTIISILHSRSIISSKHQPTGTLCSIIWKGEDPLHANIEYLPRHIHISVGDSITTSGYNSTYPSDQLIGVVSEVSLENDVSFYSAKIALTTNFYSLSHVYLLRLKGLQEQDSLAMKLINNYEQD